MPTMGIMARSILSHARPACAGMGCEDVRPSNLFSRTESLSAPFVMDPSLDFSDPMAVWRTMRGINDLGEVSSEKVTGRAEGMQH